MTTERLHKHRKTGDLVSVFKVENGEVHFAREGGGFVRRMPEHVFDEEFAEFTDDLPFRKGTVTAEFLPADLILPCYSDGRRWNGWGMPWFDKDTVNKLMAVMNAAGSELPSLSWQNGVLREYDWNEEQHVECTRAELHVDGTHISAWRIGDGWTWDAVEFDPSRK